MFNSPATLYRISVEKSAQSTTITNHLTLAAKREETNRFEHSILVVIDVAIVNIVLNITLKQKTIEIHRNG